MENRTLLMGLLLWYHYQPVMPETAWIHIAYISLYTQMLPYINL